MAPIVDTYALGPTQTNCYVVRAEAAATDAVVLDPGYDGVRPEAALHRALARGDLAIL